MNREDISKQIALIEDSIAWAKTYEKDGFPVKQLKDLRRELRRIAYALQENCSVAAYGESQVGKSYLMSSLLSSSDSPFVITNKGKGYSFIDDLNCSGGETSKTETTGVVTRFTLHENPPAMRDYIKVSLLSPADLVMLLVDSYYNDVKVDVDKALRQEQIDEALKSFESQWAQRDERPVQQALTEDDIWDIKDYLKLVGAIDAYGSQFAEVVSQHIGQLTCDEWPEVFALLWNRNPELTRLFTTLVRAYEQLGFRSEVYVPFEAVLRRKGTLLKIEWLDYVCGRKTSDDVDRDEVPTTDVYGSDGFILANGFKKSSLSALIAELTFVLPASAATDRPFLRKLDLLDFPGARSREGFDEAKINTVMHTILRRGKVAYLFQKYSRSLRISSVMFCHHNDQKNEKTLGSTIEAWINDNIGKDPAERARQLTRTNGISPLFLVATKFNLELEKTKNDMPDTPETLANHWKRFDKVLPEIVGTATWFDQWVTRGGIFGSEAFQSIYPLRDFYWSGKNKVFDGYSDGKESPKSPERCLHSIAGYPDYYDRLKKSFEANEFVKRHFANPEATWDEVVTPGSDGSKAIIRDLDAISGVLEKARRDKYGEDLDRIKREVIKKITPCYVPEDKEQNNTRTRKIIGAIRRQLDRQVGHRPEIFGRIIDQLMIPVSELRRLSYDILVLRTETPKDFGAITMVRRMAGIDPKADRETNVRILLDYYALDDEKELADELAKSDMTIDELVTGNTQVARKPSEVVSRNIFTRWEEFINRQVKELSNYLANPDEVAHMLKTLCKELGVEQVISHKIDEYSKNFAEDYQPTAIADFSSLTLNNFVSSVGHEYMTQADLEAVKAKAEACRVTGIDFSERACTIVHNQMDVSDALMAFEETQDSDTVPMEVLMKLPFWDNYNRWRNLLVIGILYAAEISHCDPVANAAIKRILEQCEALYTSNPAQ